MPVAEPNPDPAPAPVLDLDADVVALTASLCDLPSVSGDEAELADAVQFAWQQCAHLDVRRDGDAVVASTSLGRPARVLIAGHLDTVPIAANLPTWREGDQLWGRGTVDMKGGLAVMLRLAALVAEPAFDVTYIAYDHEEVEAELNGLGRLARRHPDWLAGDFAVLMEPTAALVEGGCNGTMRVDVTVEGVAAHSARSWTGVNAIHGAGEVLDRLRSYEPRVVTVDGLDYREGLNAVGIHGGIAGNVVPDRCTVSVNYRFAPDRSEAEAQAHLREVFDSFAVTVTDTAPGARPGLDRPLAEHFVTSVGGEVRAKYGWTDVALFSELGVPAVNFGPGDPHLAHRDDEHVDVAELLGCERRMLRWLSEGAP